MEGQWNSRDEFDYMHAISSGNASLRLLKKLLKTHPVDLDGLLYALSMADYEPSVEVFRLVVQESKSIMKWSDIFLIFKWLMYVSEERRMELLLDWAPPQSIMLTTDLIKLFIEEKVSIKKVTRCYKGMYSSKAGFQITEETLRKEGIQDEAWIEMLMTRSRVTRGDTIGHGGYKFVP